MFLAAIPLLGYAVFARFLANGFRKEISVDAETPLSPISVILPFRNEAKVLSSCTSAILDALGSTDQLVMVDDSSTDESLTMARELAGKDARVTVLQADGEGKKAALEVGIAAAQNDIIFTVDADVYPQSHWPAVMLQAFTEPDIHMVCGNVHIKQTESSISTLWEAIDFMSLVGSGRALTAQGWAVMCNGANLAFRKSSFERVGGYTKHKQIPSGDDVFLMHEMMHAFPGGVVPASDLAYGGVETLPQKGFYKLFQQRIRWAGKGVSYTDKHAIFVTWLIGGLSLITTILGVLTIFWVDALVSWLILWVGKAAIDTVLLSTYNRGYKRQIPLWAISIQALLYPYYTTLIAVLAPFVKFSWKGRYLSRSAKE
ncbi:glycosyltransferase [Phaeocystidibacter luteus]|uniref:Glycosyltransferase n=1 Tax=Phaeocystidibacter luteus TaxID=911197 RepID=A0A6N6RKY5_9FLAO|nr:glycosyltransferase [Phaeocystidibacter luteus]KAB2814089.1 glycosyltransferase [Phaeocystidibacter luteus]